MEPNQPNMNILSYSFSSSSSGNFGNNSKKSEQIKSKKSILRKEGSTSKSKDKHATFVEPLSQVSFYVPDVYNQNKNQRISLNTVTEEAENSHSGSDLVNNLSSNRISITSEQRINLIDNNNNSIIPNFSDNKSIEINNNINNNQQDTYFNDNNNNNNNSKNTNNIVVVKNRKKPKTRKTLDSDYYIEGLERNTQIYANNIQKDEKIENKENKSEINNKNNDSKFLEVRLSNSGVNNNFKNDNGMINLSNQNIQKSASSDNSTNEKIEQQTKINTEVNKNLFKLNNPIDLNINSVSNPQFNNNQINQNINIDINNQNKNDINYQNDNNIILTNLNNIVPKRIRKPQTNKRVTLLGITSNEYDNDSKTMFANLSNNYLNNDINNINNIEINNNKPVDFNNNKSTDFNNNLNIMNNSNINIINSNLINNNNSNTTNNNINNTNTNSNQNLLNNIGNSLFNNNDMNLNNEIKAINNINIKNNRKRVPRTNTRLTMAARINDIEYEKPTLQQIDSDYSINNSNYNNNINNLNNVNIYNAPYEPIILEEPQYVEPIITAQEKNINYENYEKYIKFNDLNINHPLSEKKVEINFGNRNNIQINPFTTSQSVRKNKLDDNLLHNLESFKKNSNSRNILNIDSSPLNELLYDRPSRSLLNELNLPLREKYTLSLNNNENFDIEKEMSNQIDFLYNNLEEKEKNWKERIIKNAERHQEFENELNKNQKELNSITNKTNEINNQINDILQKGNKYDKLSEKGQKLYDNFVENGLDIKDIEHINYKDRNCLLFKVMIKNNLSYKFIILDNIWYDKNLNGDSQVTFFGIFSTEVFTSYFSEGSIINKDNNTNLLIQKYFNETIKKVFPNELEIITINKLSYIYYLSTQISLCFIHIIKMIIYIASIDEDFTFKTDDLKKYVVKFSYIAIYGAKINLEFILNIENPFSGNYLNSVEVEKNDYILNDFDEYRKKKINLIWKYFNPKDIQINHKFFSNIFLMLGYMDKIDVYKQDINDEYIFNVMQGNILPKEDDFFENNENFNFDSLELGKQLEILYGNNFFGKNNDNKDIDNILSNNEEEDNHKKDGSFNDNDNEDIILDLPSSKNEEENEKDLNEINNIINDDK